MRHRPVTSLSEIKLRQKEVKMHVKVDTSFLVLSNFIEFLYFVSNILSEIVDFIFSKNLSSIQTDKELTFWKCLIESFFIFIEQTTAMRCSLRNSILCN